MNTTFEEELALCLRVLESEDFQFIVLQCDDDRVWRRFKTRIQEHFSARLSKNIAVQGQSYRSFMDEVYAFAEESKQTGSTGILFLDDFAALASNAEMYVGFNQRRDYLFRLPIACVCRIALGAEAVRKVSQALPDMWSFRAFTGSLPSEEMPMENIPLPLELPVERYQPHAATDAELQEISRLKEKLASLSNEPATFLLKTNLYEQLLPVLTAVGKSGEGIEYAQQYIDLLESVSSDNLPDKVALPRAYRFLGQLYEQTGWDGEAEISLKKSINQSQELCKRAGFDDMLAMSQSSETSESLAINFAKTLFILGTLLDWRSSRRKEVTEIYQESLNIFRFWSQRYRDHGKYVSEVVRAGTRLGMARLDNAEREAANLLFSEVTNCYPLLRVDESDEVLSDVALSFEMLETSPSKGRIENLGEAIAIYRRLAVRQEKYQHSLAQALRFLASAQYRISDFQGAQKSADESSEIFRHLVNKIFDNKQTSPRIGSLSFTFAFALENWSLYNYSMGQKKLAIQQAMELLFLIERCEKYLRMTDDVDTELLAGYKDAALQRLHQCGVARPSAYYRKHKEFFAAQIQAGSPMPDDLPGLSLEDKSMIERVLDSIAELLWTPRERLRKGIKSLVKKLRKDAFSSFLAAR
ncbi:MAG: hypothetical protein MUF71_17050 [Candidatus Kapabacteria bacterium]|jgi:hypothetical protein|nr:hypothetical protein [Candidatus Kapabacteria bacterium]